MIPGKEYGREEAVGPRAILDVWEEGKIFRPYWDSNPSYSGSSPSHYTALVICIHERK